LDGSKVEVANKFLLSIISHQTAVVLVALVWSSVAFCGEIHKAANNCDLKNEIILRLRTNRRAIADAGVLVGVIVSSRPHPDVYAK
jgi:hypothetical protein